MPNHNRLCKDGFFATVFVKGDEIFDSKSNMNRIKKFKARDLEVEQNVRVCNNVFVKGKIIY